MVKKPEKKKNPVKVAGELAHDLNNILATIYGYSEMILEESAGNPGMAEKIRKIHTAVGRARSITNHLLNLDKQKEEARKDVNISDLLLEIVEYIRSGKDGDIKIITQFSSPEATVSAKPEKLFRMFLNIMINGIQAIERGKGTLTVSVETTAGDNIKERFNHIAVGSEYALVSISDTGKGIPASNLESIFAPGFTTKSGSEGRGVGLSIVQEAVREAGGDIIVSSEQGKGSLFTILLPLSGEGKITM